MKKLLVRVGLTLVALVAVWLVGGRIAASRMESNAERSWAETLEPMRAFASHHPKAAPSETALELETVAARLGIDTAPADAKDRRHATEADRKALAELRTKFSPHLLKQVEQPDDSIEATPDTVSAFLAAHAADLDEIQAIVLSGGPISWETDLDRLFAAPIPSLLGQRDLQSLLILRSLERTRTGDAKAALDPIEASWRLNAGMRSRPELISQLVAVIMDRFALAALRRTTAAPEAWQQRLKEHDYRKSILRSLQVEAWLLSEFARRGTGSFTAIVNGNVDAPRTALGRWVEGPLEAPYVRMCAANNSAILAGAVAELRKADCSLDATAFGAKVYESIPRWNILARMAMPSLFRSFTQAVRISLEAELTERVLKARGLQQPDGAWSTELPGSESVACAGAKWTYKVSPQGALSLSLDKSPLPEEKGVPPLRFTFQAPGRTGTPAKRR